MDVQMPELDGLETTQQIRNPQSAVQNREIPIIAMTAYASNADRNSCLEAGMNDYVAKPVSAQALEDALEKWARKVETEKEKEITEKGGTDAKLQASNEKSQVASVQFQAPPVFDRQDLMARLRDDEALARTIIAAFLEDMPRQITLLKEQIALNEAEPAGKLAHKIKGAAASVSGMALSATAFEMEKAGKAKNLAALAKSMPDLEKRFAEYKKQTERKRE